MLQKQLEKLKKEKKTHDLFIEPLISFTKSENLTDEDLLEIIPFKTKYTTKSKERYLLTKNEEVIFNAKFKIYLKELISSMEVPGIELLLDYHIKKHAIDRFNKEEVLFLMLPFFERFELQILKLLSMKNISLNFLSAKIKEEGFLEIFLEYFKYLDIPKVKEFVLKMLDCFLENNSTINDFVSVNLFENLNIYFSPSEFQKYAVKISDRSNLYFSEKSDLNLKESNVFNEDKYETEAFDENINKNKKVKKIENITDFNLEKLDLESFKDFLKKTNLKFQKENINQLLPIFLKHNFFEKNILKQIVIKDDILEIFNKTEHKINVFKLADSLSIKIIDSIKTEDEETLLLILKFSIKEIKNNVENKIWKIDEILLKKIKEFVIKSNNEDFIFTFNEFVDLMEYENFIENIKFLVENEKILFVNEKKLKEEDRNLVFLDPKIFEINMILDFISNSKNIKNGDYRYFKTKIERIDSKKLENYVFDILVKEIKNGKHENEKYRKFLLSENFIERFVNYKDLKFSFPIFLEDLKMKRNKKLENILFEKILKNSDFIFNEDSELFFLLLIRVKLDEKRKNSLLDILSYDVELENSKNLDEKNFCSIKIKLAKILQNMDINLLEVLENLMFSIEKLRDLEFLRQIVFTYKRLCDPFIENILKMTQEIEILKIFEVRKVFPYLDIETKNNLLQNTELTNSVIKYLLKEEIKNIEIIKALLRKEEIQKILEEKEFEEKIFTSIKKKSENEIIALIKEFMRTNNSVLFENFDYLISENLEDKNLFKSFLKYSNKTKKLKLEDILEENFENYLNSSEFEIVGLILQKINKENFSLKFNQKLIDNFFDSRIQFLRILRGIFENFVDYKVCLTQLIPYFSLMLNSKDLQTKKETENLIEFIKEITGENVYEMFVA